MNINNRIEKKHLCHAQVESEEGDEYFKLKYVITNYERNTANLIKIVQLQSIPTIG